MLLIKKETLTPTAVAVLILGYWLAAVLFIRSEETVPPLATLVFEPLALDAERIGQALKELAFALVALMLFRESAVFRRSIAGEPTTRGLLLALMLLQLLVLGLNVALMTIEDQGDLRITNGLLLVLVAGLLGGWRSGFGLGVFTALVYAGYDWWFLPAEEREVGLSANLLWHLLLNFEAMSAVTAGMLAGFCRASLGPRVFGVGGLLVLGLVSEWLAAWMDLLVTSSTEDLTLQFPVALMNAAVLAVFGLLVRSARGEMVQRRLAEAEAARSKAELLALRRQITPHFLFNALTSILYFIRTDAGRAYQLLTDLSEVFRSLLGSDEFVTLEDELQLVRSYLALEQARLKERLTVSWQLEDSLDHTRLIPALILQPLVENAIVHGIGPNPEGGRLTIGGRMVNGEMLLTVIDSGNHSGRPSRQGAGVALANIRQRLAALYGDDYAPDLQQVPGGETRITLRIAQ